MNCRTPKLVAEDEAAISIFLCHETVIAARAEISVHLPYLAVSHGFPPCDSFHLGLQDSAIRI